MCGLPGSGKSTTAKRLADERHAVRLTKDEWLWAMGSTPWDRVLGERIEGELTWLAGELLALGVSVVLDFGLWSREERDRLRDMARGLGVGVELHDLKLSTAELWRRIDARNAVPPWNAAPITRSDLDGWVAVFEAPEVVELALFDDPPSSAAPEAASS